MTSPERNIAQIGHTSVDPGASVLKVPVVEDLNLRPSENPDRREVVAKISGQAWQAVTAAHAEVITLKARSRIETCSAPRIRAVIPPRIPRLRPRPIHPRIVRRRWRTRPWWRRILRMSGRCPNRKYCTGKHKNGESLHGFPPAQVDSYIPEILHPVQTHKSARAVAPPGRFFLGNNYSAVVTALISV